MAPGGRTSRSLHLPDQVLRSNPRFPHGLHHHRPKARSPKRSHLHGDQNRRNLHLRQNLSQTAAHSALVRRTVRADDPVRTGNARHYRTRQRSVLRRPRQGLGLGTARYGDRLQRRAGPLDIAIRAQRRVRLAVGILPVGHSDEAGSREAACQTDGPGHRSVAQLDQLHAADGGFRWGFEPAAAEARYGAAV
uniref:(northern house mosquito) hypothetical protein n=1 Tax=Culex pipiens TaxID=7175 RepID=A0A8D8AKF5_CULPI